MESRSNPGAERTVGVTLQVDGGQAAAIELPLDVPIGRVVDHLVAQLPAADVRQRGPRDWQLGTTWGRPFPRESSLADSGIFEGSILVLADGSHWMEQKAQEPETGSWPAAAPAWAGPAAAEPPGPEPAAERTGPDQGVEMRPSEPAAQLQPGSQPAAPQPAALATVAAEEGAQPVSRPSRSNLPQERTRRRLPARTPPGDRIRELAGALAGRADRDSTIEVEPEPPPPDRPVSPRLLTLTEAPRALVRARSAWRQTSYMWRLEQAIAAPQLRSCVTVAVMSPKGGVGKTTVTALLGTLLSMVRRDRVVAVDANPDFGSLGRILTADHDVYVDDLAEVLDDPRLTVTALDQNLGRAPHGLMVLPAPIDPLRMERLDEASYTHILDRLRQLVGVILVDCGTGLYDPAGRAAIRAADQLVLVSDPDPATASLVAGAAALLHERGAPIWAVVNRMPRDGGRLDLDAFGTHVAFARGLVTLPAEPEAVRSLTESTFDWSLAPPRLREGVAELALDLISAWPELGVA